MKENKTRIAIVGYGGMGKWHADRIHARNDAELAGIYDISPEREAEAQEKNIHVYNSLQEVAADKSIHLVTIATPNDVHMKIAVTLMNSGKSVICEKPVAMSSAELETMLEAANRNKVIFTVHQNRRWDEDYLIIKELYEKSTLGSIFSFEHRIHGSRGIPGDWRNQKQHGGGMVFDWGIHLIDQMLTMLAGKKVVSVYAETTFVTNEGVDDGCKCFIKFDNGVTFLVEIGTNNFISLPMWYVLGENGSAVIHDWDNSGEIVMVSDWENRDAVPIIAGAGLTKTMAPRTDESIKKYPLPEVKSDHEEFYSNLIDAINGKAEPLITHQQLRRSMKLVEAIFKSAETGEVVREVI